MNSTLSGLLDQDSQKANDYLVKQFTAYAAMTALKFAVVRTCKDTGDDPKLVMENLLDGWQTAVMAQIQTEAEAYQKELDDTPAMGLLLGSLAPSPDDILNQYQEAMESFFPPIKKSMINGVDDINEATKPSKD